MAKRNYSRYPIPFAKRIPDIDGGINNKIDPLKIEDNQFEDIRDWHYDSVGNLKMRGGITAITVNSGSDAVRYTDKWKRDDTEDYYDIFVAGEKLYYKDGITVVELADGITADAMVCTESYGNRLYIASRGQNLRVIDSDLSVRTAGCAYPEVAPTVAANGAGVLDGDYYYCYTFVYPWGESSKSPTSALISPSSEKVLVTAGETYPAGATGIKFYRTADGSTVLEELATVSYPTESYDDNNSDGVLGDDVPDDNNGPPISRWVKNYKNYMYYIEDNSSAIWYSKLTYPEIVYSYAYDTPIKDSSNLPIAIEFTANPSFLVWFFEKTILSYSGTSPFLEDEDPLVKQEINWTLGCRSPYTIRKVDGNIIFLGNDNRLYMLSRVILALTETVEPTSISENIERILQEDLNLDMQPYFYGQYVNRRYYLYVATGTSTYLNKLLIMDLNLEDNPWVSAMPDTQGMSLGIVEDSSGKDQLYIGGSESTNLYQYDEGNTDLGVQINPYLKSKKFDLGYPFNRKVWRKLRIHGEGTPEFQFTVRVTVTKNGSIKDPADFIVRGSAWSSDDLETYAFADEHTFGEEGVCFCTSTGYSTDVAEFKEEIDIRDDGEFMQFEILDVTSTYRLYIKTFEITGQLYKARAT